MKRWRKKKAELQHQINEAWAKSTGQCWWVLPLVSVGRQRQGFTQCLPQFLHGVCFSLLTTTPLLYFHQNLWVWVWLPSITNAPSSSSTWEPSRGWTDKGRGPHSSGLDAAPLLLQTGGRAFPLSTHLCKTPKTEITSSVRKEPVAHAVRTRVTDVSWTYQRVTSTWCASSIKCWGDTIEKGLLEKNPEEQK